MIEIGDKEYVFDIKKIANFFNYSDANTSKETEILDTYEHGSPIAKTVRELTTPANAQIDSIKYDLIKTFIVQIITYEAPCNNYYDLPFGMKLAVDTMVKEGFLVEVK